MIDAPPYTARQCPICKLWIYTAAGPFAENDPTKTVADYNHWAAAHATAEQLNATAIGFPYFPWNEIPVEAVMSGPTLALNDLTRDSLIAWAKTKAGYGLLDTPCEPRRSAYVDGPGGDSFYQRAVDRWTTYRLLMLDQSDLLTDADVEVLG